MKVSEKIQDIVLRVLQEIVTLHRISSELSRKVRVSIKAESQFETWGIGIKQIQTEMGRGGQPFRKNAFDDCSIT